MLFGGLVASETRGDTRARLAGRQISATARGILFRFMGSVPCQQTPRSFTNRIM